MEKVVTKASISQNFRDVFMKEHRHKECCKGESYALYTGLKIAYKENHILWINWFCCLVYGA